MKKVQVAICIEDSEYERRLTNCLLARYNSQLELHLYTGLDQFMEARKRDFDIVLMGDCVDCHKAGDFLEQIKEIKEQISQKIIYLLDLEEYRLDIAREEEVIIIEKYQEVNLIVDEILRQVGDEIRDMKTYGEIRAKTKVYAVYSLTENEYQLPFAVTMASILGEKQRVLVLDLQENSGFTQLLTSESAFGLEELIVMAESGKYSSGRIVSCIGHLDKIDYVYPMTNTENICELNSHIYEKLIQMLCQELSYDVIIMNLGARFMGFYEVLNQCRQVYLMQKPGGLCQWRQFEFMDEIDRRGFTELREKIVSIDIPILTSPIVSCERLIEQWKWNEFGDTIRSKIPEVARVG